MCSLILSGCIKDDDEDNSLHYQDIKYYNNENVITNHRFVINGTNPFIIYSEGSYILGFNQETDYQTDSIYYSISSDLTNWSQPKLIMKHANLFDFITHNNIYYVLYLDSNWQVNLIFSTDLNNWSEPKIICKYENTAISMVSAGNKCVIISKYGIYYLNNDEDTWKYIDTVKIKGWFNSIYFNNKILLLVNQYENNFIYSLDENFTYNMLDTDFFIETPYVFQYQTNISFFDSYTCVSSLKKSDSSITSITTEELVSGKIHNGKIEDIRYELFKFNISTSYELPSIPGYHYMSIFLRDDSEGIIFYEDGFVDEYGNWIREIKACNIAMLKLWDSSGDFHNELKSY